MAAPIVLMANSLHKASWQRAERTRDGLVKTTKGKLGTMQPFQVLVTVLLWERCVFLCVMRSADTGEVRTRHCCGCGIAGDWSWLWTGAVWASTATIPFRQTRLSHPSLHSHPPSRSMKVIDFICATQANIQSPQAPDLWSVNHLAVLILSPCERFLDPDPCQSSATRQ